jgi:hypothetical protein
MAGRAAAVEAEVAAMPGRPQRAASVARIMVAARRHAVMRAAAFAAHRVVTHPTPMAIAAPARTAARRIAAPTRATLD